MRTGPKGKKAVPGEPIVQSTPAPAPSQAVIQQTVSQPVPQQTFAPAEPVLKSQPQPALFAQNNEGLAVNQSVPQTQPQAQGDVLTTSQHLPRLFGGLISKNPLGEYLRKYNEIAIEILKDQKADGVLFTRAFDARQFSMNSSAIALCYSGEAGHLTVYVLIVAASISNLSPTVYNYGGQSIEVQNTPAQTWSTEMWNQMKSVLANSTGAAAPLEVHYAGFGVIPSEVTIDELHKDKTKVTLQSLLSDAYNAISHYCSLRLGGANVFNLSAIPKSDRLCVKIDYSSVPSKDSAGLPVRSDLTVSLFANTNANIQQQVTNPYPGNVASQDITAMGGFVELLYNAQHHQMMGGMMPGMFPGMMPGMFPGMDTRAFVPRYVMTKFNTGIDALTLELLLLGIHQTSVLNKSLAWAYAFRPGTARRLNDDIDIRDIGAVGYDIPALIGSQDGRGDKIDTKSSQFDDMAFLQLIHRSIMPELVFSIDIPEATTDAWLFTIIRDCTQAGDIGNLARRQLVTAADNLTNGRFSQIFKGNVIVVDDNNRIHNGYYKNKATDELHDIRDLDYLAILNMVGKVDHKYAIAYESTFSNNNVPIEMRLQERWKILQNVFGITLKHTGYSNRYTFHPDFLRALTESIQAEGHNIQPNNINMMHGSMQRGYNIANMAMAASVLNQAFQMTAPNMSYGGYNGMANNYLMPAGPLYVTR